MVDATFYHIGAPPHKEKPPGAKPEKVKYAPASGELRITGLRVMYFRATSF
jgi:hypothetical protein